MIDAHQHYWRLGRNGCVWPTPELTAIHRDFGPDDWRSLAAPLGVEGSVAVQSQPDPADTAYLLDLAETEASILGVVGWIEMEAPDAAGRLAGLAARPAFRGVRPMLQSLDADDWIAEARIDAAVEALIAHDLAFDALVFTRHLPHLARFARRWPPLRIVIDHGAKPPIAGDLGRWTDEMRAIAALPNVCCKLSGLATEAAPGQGPAALAPAIATLFDLFGPDRLIWGSDWPVLNLAGDYAGWLAQCRELAEARFGPELAAPIFEANARRFYRLPTAAIVAP